MNISCRFANANTQCGRICNPPERTPKTREEINQLEKQIKHEERKSHETGETHHRR